MSEMSVRWLAAVAIVPLGYSGSESSVTFCILAKRYILAKNCLKE